MLISLEFTRGTGELPRYSNDECLRMPSLQSFFIRSCFVQADRPLRLYRSFCASAMHNSCLYRTLCCDTVRCRLAARRVRHDVAAAFAASGEAVCSAVDVDRSLLGRDRQHEAHCQPWAVEPRCSHSWEVWCPDDRGRALGATYETWVLLTSFLFARGRPILRFTCVGRGAPTRDLCVCARGVRGEVRDSRGPGGSRSPMLAREHLCALPVRACGTELVGRAARGVPLPGVVV